MADPRFYENRGPVALAAICARLKLEVPAGACGDAAVADVATIESAGPDHLVFCATRAGAKQLPHARAGYCLADAALEVEPPAGMILLRTSSSIAAFAVVAQMLYPDNALTSWAQTEPISASANIGKQVQFGPGVVVGAKAEIGDGTRIGPSTVIGPGVAIGRNCEIGSNVTITHAYLGDEILVLPGAQIGQPGFGFASGPRGHAKIPQLGRVIVQDRVEIGACTTVDRGALGDTVIGEGTKIDNLVQIGHNAQIGRHCVIVGQVGMSGSCELGDFVVLGGQVGLADHVKIGDGARLAARSAMPPGVLPGGQDYGGAPPVPIREWRRQIAVIARLTKKSKQHANG